MMLAPVIFVAALGPFAADWREPIALPETAEPEQCAQIQQTESSEHSVVIRPAPVELTDAFLDANQAALSCERELPLLAQGQSKDLPSISIELDLSALSSSSSSQNRTSSVSTKLTQPTDTSRYELLAGSGCSELSTPLDSVAPASVPGVALALVPAGQAAAVASRSGAQLLREVALDSIDKTLALMASDNAGLLALLAADPDVSASQPEHLYRTAAVTAPDPLAGLAYAPQRMGLGPLLAELTGAAASVAVIDTGADVEHPDLVMSSIATLDTTGASYVAEAHGTAVVGVIAAAKGNGEGGFGLAPGTDVFSIRACQAVSIGALAARCRSSSLAAAIDAAISADVDIINLSLTGPPDPLLAELINAALDAGIVVVAAAGNGGPLAKPAFPAALPGVFAVTATDASDAGYPAANQGAYIDVSAPGVDILAPGLDGRYPTVSGTSFAAAQVTAVLAMLIELTNADQDTALTDALSSSAFDLGAEGPDIVFGRGLINGCQSSVRLGMPVAQCQSSQQ
ncbi:MAG: S8 family serine peptidase [Pseudomonadaceae bacterium]|nr:S8 family serine peptidase [Pseudomonadaceae bacterium]